MSLFTGDFEYEDWRGLIEEFYRENIEDIEEGLVMLKKEISLAEDSGDFEPLYKKLFGEEEFGAGLVKLLMPFGVLELGYTNPDLGYEEASLAFAKAWIPVARGIIR